MKATAARGVKKASIREAKWDTHGDDDNNYNEHPNHSSENLRRKAKQYGTRSRKGQGVTAAVDGNGMSLDAKWCASRESNPGPSLGKRG